MSPRNDGNTLIDLGRSAGESGGTLHFERWRIVGWVVLCVACADEQDGPRSTDALLSLPDASVRCDDGPNDPTALGVSAAELAEGVAGSYALTVQALKSVPAGVQVLGARTLTVTVALTAEQVPGLDDCALVEAPVRVHVQSVDPALD